MLANAYFPNIISFLFEYLLFPRVSLANSYTESH